MRALAFAVLGAAACNDADIVERSVNALSVVSPDGGAGQAEPEPLRDAGAVRCGDGRVAEGEQCEPPGSAGCNESCQFSLPEDPCGNGALTASEECDDGNRVSEDGCSSACRREICGNGRVDPGETCDRRDATCSASCQTIPQALPSCGNRQLEAGEQCDDGNVVAGDGCTPDCRREVCGDRRLDQGPLFFGERPGEACDPPEPGYCDDTCQLIRCGDGRKSLGEECDDGNTQARDGCSPTCRFEVCGDGVINQVAGKEQCEPAGTASCDASCRRIVCGNGLRQGLEQCDDGNLVNGDGCDASCKSEGCGNGQLDPMEDCEPPGVGLCDASCRALHVECGDGRRDPGEECDDHNLAFGDGCSPTCQLESCGNGRVELPREQCDPPGGSCSRSCQRARCGDGEVSAPEECDDGNIESGDGCSAVCQQERCGNGRVDPGEQCEPPGSSTCDALCRSLVAPLALPLGAALFQLQNATFDTSLEHWQASEAAPTVRFNPSDMSGSVSSGSAEVMLAGAAGATALASSAASASLAQCVRTGEGATYQLAVRAATPPSARVAGTLQLGARFFTATGCTGAVVGGFASAYGLAPSSGWSRLVLPAAASGQPPSFAAPAGASSMQVWLELVAPSDAVAGALLDGVELLRSSPPRCGNGVPEANEECEPSVTAACSAGCTLRTSCGDGVASASECAGTPVACPRDCPPRCGDARVQAPEECDPPLPGACTSLCTLQRSQCGDGQVEAGEQCDPPNGASCSATCQRLAAACGNGQREDPEECDLGAANGLGECSSACRLRATQPSVCGDGLRQGAEECDPPNPKTWCSVRCQRVNPAQACGNGRVDADLGEQCDPPGVRSDCSADCARPVCGDGKVGGREQCDARGDARCQSCTLVLPSPSTSQAQCLTCLAQANRCVIPEAGDHALPAQDLYADCFGLEGTAQSGPAQGTALRQLCIEAVECMRASGCASETRGQSDSTPAACYCGKSILVEDNAATSEDEQERMLRQCRDGVLEATGACRRAFERAAEVTPAAPGAPTRAGSVLAALDPARGKPALKAGLRLMSECGPKPAPDPGTRVLARCAEECAASARCNDGIVEPGESCDPGDPTWGARCDATHCSILPCGNGVVDRSWPYANISAPADWKPETCDVADPYTNAECDACQLRTACGDGKLSALVEACDPGPLGDWGDCCKGDELGDTPKFAACDRDGNVRIDAAEKCQIPSRCGDGKRTGSEECDPQAPSAGDDCDDDCHVIEDAACKECSGSTVGEGACGGVLHVCYASTAPFALKAGCFDVLDCVRRTHCADNNPLDCLCGDIGADACSRDPHPPGPCRDVITANSGCELRPAQPGQVGDPVVPVCPQAQFLNDTYGAGAAMNIVQCRSDNCFDQCYAAPRSGALP